MKLDRYRETRASHPAFDLTDTPSSVHGGCHHFWSVKESSNCSPNWPEHFPAVTINRLRVVTLNVWVLPQFITHNPDLD
jgi:hypothetical protein